MNSALTQLKLDPDQISQDPQLLMEYGRDWTRYHQPKPLAVLFPKNIEEIQKIVLWARTTGMALVPSGGRTGLSGGAVAYNGEAVLSLSKMNRILEFDPIDSTLTCQAGCITETLQNEARDKGLFYPVDFASRGSSQMGGNVATNAGGIRVLKYGLTRNWVSSMTVVTGTGEVLKLNNSLVKNATGYDLRHLIIGSEGTLAIIAEVTVKLLPEPPTQKLFLLGLNSLEHVMKVYDTFRKNAQLTAFEFFTGIALEHVLKQNSNLADPFDARFKIYLLVEVEASSEVDLEKHLKTLETCMESWILDGRMAQSDSQYRDFWKYREDISEALSKHTPYKNDVSVRVSQVTEFMAKLDEIFSRDYPDLEVIWFGHIGDGNLHISILKPESSTMDEFVKRCQAVDDHLYSAIQNFGGSISAEHGVGLTKKKFLGYSRSPEEISIMKAIKKIFDPDHILNPGKIFD